MDPRHLHVDDRMAGWCVYCSSAAAVTRDHVPSKVLLDEPYPLDLPVVPACDGCNHGFSLDEQYVACMIECARSGSVEPGAMGRAKVAAILTEVPSLAERIAASRDPDAVEPALWRPDMPRVRAVVLKLARGHAAYEQGELRVEEPDTVEIVPLPLMSPEERRLFLEGAHCSTSWPEVGSRAFLEAITDRDPEAWRVVQAGRYQYRVSLHGGLVVEILLSDYLACRVVWRCS